MYNLALDFQERSQENEARLLNQFEDASAKVMDRLGDLIIVDDEDERLVLGATGKFRAEVLPEDSDGEWRELDATEELVEFYDPTDIFGDLADALAEAFPSIAPDEGEGADGARRPGRGRGRRSTRPRQPTAPAEAEATPTATGAPTRRSASGLIAPPGRPRMRAVGAELVERREVVPGQWMTAWHSPSIVMGARAGQYVHVRTVEAGGLPRPPAVPDRHGRCRERHAHDPRARRATRRRLARPAPAGRHRRHDRARWGGRSRSIRGPATCC